MRLVTARQASEELGIKYYTLMKGAKDGIYPHIKSGNRFLFDVEILEKTIRERMLKSCTQNKEE